MKKFYRSGDHNFHQIDKLPKGLKEVKHNGRFVYGIGESSNHKHILVAERPETLKIYRDENGDYYFDVRESVSNQHVVGDSVKTADHQPIVIDPGIYKQIHEREVDIFSQVIHKTVD
jgi:hypothetical protein